MAVERHVGARISKRRWLGTAALTRSWSFSSSRYVLRSKTWIGILRGIWKGAPTLSTPDSAPYSGPERRTGYRPESEPPPADYHGPERRSGYPPASKQEVADMRLAQENLDRAVRGLHSQLRSLDSTLRDFVPRRELEEGYSTKRELADEHDDAAQRRRLIAAGLSFGIVVAVQIHDAHVEHCRPIMPDGSIGPPETSTVEFLCSVSFPLSDYSNPTGGPADPGDAGHFLGLFLYAVFFAWTVKEAIASYRTRGD
jgi:hypothetical protein